MEVVNLFGDEWDGRRDRPGWHWSRLDVGDRAGAELLGASLYELEPGEKSFPYHWHHGQEEMLVVVDGEPTLRTPEGERQLSRGDVVAFRRGPEGAHLIRNDTKGAVRVLMLSTIADYEVAQYPDSGKIGIWAEGLRLIVRPESGVDYFDGEE